jgi:voltage-gated potassium channel
MIKFKYVFLMIFIVGVYLASVVAIENLERLWSISTGIPNGFESATFLNNLRWLLVFSVSGHDGGLFPSSTAGQFVTMLIPLVGVGGLIAFVGMLTSDHVKNHMLISRGMMATSLKDHIIVCGWNRDTPYLVKNLVHENLSHKRAVVILADVREEMPLVQHELEHDLVSFVRGVATKRADLDKANIVGADVALLVADDSDPDPDAANILKALTIEKYCLELEATGRRRGRPNIRTVAEVNQTDNATTARDALVDEIVSLGHIRSKIFVQAALTPGSLTFINEILTYNELNDIYPIPIGIGSALVHRTFDDLVKILRTKRILLMSICRWSTSGQRSSKSRRMRTVITNPFTDEEIKYRTQHGDSLIVLARVQSDIDEATALIEADASGWSESQPEGAE